jgi:lysophospholipase L1-like esterase
MFKSLLFINLLHLATSQPVPIPAGYTFIAPGPSSKIQSLGRVLNNADGSFSFDYAASGVQFSITGATSFYAIFNQTAYNFTGGNNVPLLVNNKMRTVSYTFGGSNIPDQIDEFSTFTVSPDIMLYPAAAGIDPSVTTYFRIVKLTEPSYNNGVGFDERITFLGLAISEGGSIQPMQGPQLEKRIEILGDSLNAGYGDLNVASECFSGANRHNEDHFLTPSYLLQRSFKADVRVIAWSGKGLYENNGNGYFDRRMPSIYRGTLGSVYAEDWDFSSWVPDAVLVNLGSNDYSTPNASKPEFSAAFTQTYVDLMVNITTQYYTKSTPIFAIVGPLSTYYNSTLNAVTQAKQLGINATLVDIRNIAFLTPDGLGCSAHPSFFGNIAQSKIIASAIHNVTGWLVQNTL